MKYITVKPVLSSHSKKRPKIGFQDRLSLNAGQKYCRMLQESILQYFLPALSDNRSLRPLFCPFLSGHLRPVLLCYIYRRWERGGSVVECLTRDGGAAGSSLIGVTALCP